MSTVTGGEEMDAALIVQALDSAEPVFSDWVRRELKIPTVRSVKFCSIMAVEETDWVVATSRMMSGFSG